MRDRKQLAGARSGNADLSFSLERFDESGFFPSTARSNGYTLLLIEKGRARLKVGECAISLDNGGLLAALSPYQAFELQAVEDYAGILGLPAKALSRECIEGTGKGARAVIIDRLGSARGMLRGNS